jgi:hypothetical protein
MTKITQRNIYLFFWDELTKQTQYDFLSSKYWNLGSNKKRKLQPQQITSSKPYQITSSTAISKNKHAIESKHLEVNFKFFFFVIT